MAHRSRFDLETALATWRHSLKHRRAFLPDDLDELERHVRDQVAAAVARGHAEEAAFRRAVQDMGDYGLVEHEYEKVYWHKLKHRHALVPELHTRLAMLKNYVLVALRNVRRHPTFAFINIIGLAVGLACSFLILLWVQDEMRYDRFLPDGDRIHRVWRNVTIDGEVFTWGATAKPVGDVIGSAYPAIEAATLTFSSALVVAREDVQFREAGLYAGDRFFDVFPHPFLQGDPATALQGTEGAVITARTAAKFFGDDWADTGVLGQTLTLDQRKDFTVTGVIEDPPLQTSLPFDVLLPLEDFFARNTWVDTWGANAFPLYVRLAPRASADAVSAQIAQVINDNEEGATEVLFLQAYEDMYLHSEFEDGQLAGGRIEHVRLFGIVAVFLLLIAAINFMNLATARSARRAREIGVRKAIGAHRRSLILQFIGESVLTSFFALAAALVLTFLLLPAFNDLTGKAISTAAIDARFWVIVLLTALGVGVLAGSYPALYLSSFTPLTVLRGTFRQRPSAAWLRRGLVVFQFALSVLLIVTTLAVYLQIDYVRSKDLGLNRDGVVEVAQEGALRTQYDVYRRTLLAQPGIEAVTAASTNPLNIRRSTGSVTWPGKAPDAEYEVSVVFTDFDFVETMQMELTDGRTFSRAFGAEEGGFLVNETLAALIGGDVVGSELSVWGDTGRVIGVVGDFHMTSLFNPVGPLLVGLAPQGTSSVYVRLAAGQTAEGLAALEHVTTTLNPAYPFTYSFLDDAFETTYRSETVMGTLAGAFALVAILISCLGLYGLVAFSTEQRTKEIGVRKVMGASVPQLVLLLTGETTKLVLLGVALALPVAHYFASDWLSQFAYRIDLGWGLFLGAGLLALGVAWLTVSYQSFKAAHVNPVESLRYE